MKTSKVFFLGFVFSFFLTVAGFFGWRENQDLLVYGEVAELGHATFVKTVLNAPEGKRLVPEGCVWGNDEIDELVYVYDVTLAEDETLDVMVTTSSFERDGRRWNDDGLLRIRIETVMTSTTHARVTVRVTIDLPETEAEYDAVAGAVASFTLSFERTKPN